MVDIHIFYHSCVIFAILLSSQTVIEMELRILNEHELINLYTTDCRRDFPESELKPLDVVEKLYREGNYEPIGFFENGTLIAYALQVIRENGKSVLLDYLAVTPEYRNRGVGSAVLTALRKYYSSQYEYIVIESEHPAEAPDKNAALRRLDFYKRAGGILTDTQVRLFDILFLIFALPCSEKLSAAPFEELEKIYRVTVPPELYDEVVDIFSAEYK